MLGNGLPETERISEEKRMTGFEMRIMAAGCLCKDLSRNEYIG